MGFLNWQALLVALPGVLVAITFHEYCHGLVALWLGDPTAQRAGRLSPEPWAHIDWLGFLALLILGFGWAKPVPIDPRYFRRPQRDMMWVGLAGPVSNFVMALLTALVLAGWLRVGLGTTGVLGGVYLVLQAALLLNIAFGIFNLIPIPPLDGSRVLAGVLPARAAQGLYRLEPYGLFILVAALLLTPVLAWLGPVRSWVATVLYTAATHAV